MFEASYNCAHKRLKPFKCSEWDYAAQQSGDLKHHINIVHKCLKSFKCFECNYSAQGVKNIGRWTQSKMAENRDGQCSDVIGRHLQEN